MVRASVPGSDLPRIRASGIGQGKGATFTVSHSVIVHDMLLSPAATSVYCFYSLVDRARALNACTRPTDGARDVDAET